MSDAIVPETTAEGPSPRTVRRGDEQAPERAAEPEVLPRLALAVVCVLITAACFTQAPGHIIADTKLDLYVDPGRFLSRALNLWDSSGSFGLVQNQAVGYLFPMGPFFLAARAVAIPVWVAQRLWLALLVSLAVTGAARVAAALRVGSSAGWVLAGLIYGLSPFVVAQLASTSAAVIPAALVPWALLPLIHAARAGSPRRAAGWSGLAVLAMGGVNAASTLCVLPLPALYLLTRRHSKARSALIAWWLAAVVLACAWWAVALLFQGHWGLDFIRFTETAATTQSTTSALETLRGTSAWLSYLHLGQAWDPAGWSLATSPAAIVATCGLAAVGVAGLARRELPERRFVVGAFALGMVCVTAGYIGPASGLAGSAVQSLLSGPAPVLRNTAKFEPVLTLPLALGAAYVLGSVKEVRARALAAAAAVALVLVAVLPFWQDKLPTAGSFKSIPAYWYRLADFMRAHAAGSRTLLMPSAAFAEYDWGRPMDEPLEALATTPWAVRNLLPLGGIGSTQLLDAIEGEVVDGQVSSHLGEVLARAGISYVVARNDLNWQLTDSPPPSEVVAALTAGGLRPVIGFGPSVPSNTGLAALGLPKSQLRVPSLEVFAVPGGASLAATYPQAGTVVLSGGPQSLPQLAGQGQLGDHAVVLASDLPGHRLGSGDRWVVSDASRRQAQDFGLIESNFSYTLQAGERSPGSTNLQVVPPAPGAQQAVARYRGNIASVSASSYGSWLLQIPELAPANAFDGDPATAWAPGTVDSSVGQWVQANLTGPVEVSHVGVRLLEDGPWRPRVHRITVTTRVGSLTSTVVPDEAMQTVPVRPGPTTFVRVTFASVSGQTRGGATAGLRDVSIPGVAATRYIQPPEEPTLLSGSAAAGITPSFDLTRQTANQTDLLRRDPEAQLAREIELPSAARMRITGTVLPTPGAALDSLLTRTHGLTVSASSSWDELPRYRPGNAIDGSARTAWIAAPLTALPADYPSAPGIAGTAGPDQPERVSPVPAVADPHPSLSLSWKGERTLSSVAVVPAGGFAAPPTVLRLASPQGDRVVPVAPGARLTDFRPLRTSRVTVTFPGVALRYTGSADGTRVRLPVGLAELDFPALRSLEVIAPAPALKVDLPCGRGPAVTIDGRRFATSLSTTAGDIVAQRSIPFTLCAPRQTISLSAGTHWILSPAGGAFTVTNMTISAAAAPPPAPAAARRVSVVHWGADSRELRLGAGAASYLAVRENFNAGWQATVNGRRLEPIRLDGWEQGFLVPAGAAATLQLTYGPNRAFQLGLIMGAALVLVLLALALVPVRKRFAGLEAVSEPAVLASRTAELVIAACVLAAAALVSWPALIALVPLGILAGRRPQLLPAVAGLALLAAGIVVAVHVLPFPTEHGGTFGPYAEILAGIAFVAVLASQLRSWSAAGRPRLRPETKRDDF